MVCDFIWLGIVLKEPVVIVSVTEGLEKTLSNIACCSWFV